MDSWKRKLRMGMVGGGQGAFIGGVHRTAAAMDGQIELCAGCFSRDFENTKTTGEQLYLDSGRLYKSYEEMAEKEAKLPDDQKIDFVSIVTPNKSHFPIAKAFLEALMRQRNWLHLLKRAVWYLPSLIITPVLRWSVKQRNCSRREKWVRCGRP
jgi:hypothetical protein